MENCKVCDRNSVVRKCTYCGITCCNECQISHAESCLTLRDKKYHVCLDHGFEVQGYCFACCLMICEKCNYEEKHKDHNVKNLIAATEKIKENMKQCYEELNDKDVMARKFKEDNSDAQNSYDIIASQIKAEGSKWAKMIGDITNNLCLQLEILKQNSPEMFCSNEQLLENLKDVKNDLSALQHESSPHVFLAKWLNILQSIGIIEKKQQDLHEKHLQLNQPLMFAKDIENNFRTLILSNGGPSVIGSENIDTIDDLSASFSTLITMKENHSLDRNRQRQSGHELQRCDQDMRNRVEKLQKEVELLLTENEKKETAIKQIHLAETNINDLKKAMQELKEKNNVMAVDLELRIYETDEMLKIVKSVSQELIRIEDAKKISDVVSNIMRNQNKVLDEFNIQLVTIFNQFVNINNRLIISEQQLQNKCEEMEMLRQAHKKELENVISSFGGKLEEMKLNSDSKLHKHSQSSDLQQERFHLHQIKQQHDQQLRALYQENEDLRIRLLSMESLHAERDKECQRFEQTIMQLKLEISQGSDALVDAKQAKDDIQNRLSKVAGEKLTKGNPAITDLGDPNRPMKVGELYGGLYDNEWTDAMECTDQVKGLFPDLEKSEVEEIIVHHLFKILTTCYVECVQLSKEQCMYIAQVMQVETSQEQISSLPCCKDLALIRRQNSEKFASYLFTNKILHEKILTSPWDYPNKSTDLMKQLLETPFFTKCVKLCWLMVIQEPAMYLSENLLPDTVYDKNVFKEFVQSGDKVTYVVWPALYLHKNGPLLYKGVVQAHK